MSPGFVGLEWKLSHRDGRGGRTHAEEGILDETAPNLDTDGRVAWQLLDLSCAGAPSDTAPHLDPSKSELLSILTASVSKSTPLLGSVLGAFWPDEEGATNNLKDECGTYMMGLRKDEDRGTRTLPNFCPKVLIGECRAAPKFRPMDTRRKTITIPSRLDRPLLHHTNV
ncbi:hypothetical protein SCLCIDRAFT_21934 [Scleroderma citrinum Foug A]|uniref:Uncharacterized protein n=1 Tax=Scleroderma citrinum Foug A TaxID=1036808 RepID=A0A0C2ZYC5_9AGAM|nr:hypothetical protein SCLCIDRAFT_21934 [Scleroderma citrinum Foug A]